MRIDWTPPNPCYGCEAPKRHIGCHSDCPEYLSFLERNETVKAARHREGEFQAMRYELDKAIYKHMRQGSSHENFGLYAAERKRKKEHYDDD